MCSCVCVKRRPVTSPLPWSVRHPGTRTACSGVRLRVFVCIFVYVKVFEVGACACVCEEASCTLLPCV